MHESILAFNKRRYLWVSLLISAVAITRIGSPLTRLLGDGTGACRATLEAGAVSAKEPMRSTR